jgi:hypothetical protein
MLKVRREENSRKFRGENEKDVGKRKERYGYEEGRRERRGGQRKRWGVVGGGWELV